MRFISRLDSVAEIDWDSGGLISLSGVAVVPPLSVKDLVTAACVPFAKATKIPSQLRLILIKNEIPIRNHLVKASLSPPWHPYFRL